MVSAKITKEIIEKQLLPAAEKLIKGGKTTKAEKLLTKPKTEVQVGEQKISLFDDGKTGTNVKVDKRDLAKEEIVVKKPKAFKDIKETSIQEADDILFAYNNKIITPKVLDDFNISKFQNKEDIANFIELISKKYSKSIDKQKRGVQTEEQLKTLSTLLQQDPKKLTKTILSLKPGQTLNAEYMFAARELLGAGMVKLDDMAKIVSSGNATDIQKLEFRQHFALMSEFQKIVKGVQTETARTFRQFQIPTRDKKFTHVDLDDINKNDLLVELGGSENTVQMATMFLKTGSSSSKMKFTQEAGSLANIRKVSDSVAEIFINAILSNPMTHIRNTGGNWLAQAIVQMERKAVARLYGGKVEDGVAAYEDIARAFGKSMAAQEMMAALGNSLKGRSLKDILRKFDELIPATHGGSKIEIRSHRASAENFNIENKVAAGTVDVLGRILTLDRIPTRMLTTADNFFKNREYRAEIYALAFRETMENIQKGTLKEGDASMFLADRVLNPTSTMVKSANEGMMYSVFQTKMKDRGDFLGTIGNIAQKGKGSTGYFTWLTNYYIPFTQTPINIAGFVAERTPVLARLLTNYSDEIAAGGARKQMAEMKLRLGTMFYFAMAIPGYYGVTSGSDIQIPGKATGGKFELMKSFNYQPNSIRWGGTQINLTGLDPLTTMMSNAANLGAYSEAMLNKTGIDKAYSTLIDQNKIDLSSVNEELIAQYTMAYILSFGENLTNSTFLKGAGDMVNDLQNLSKVMSGDMPVDKFGKKTAMDYAKAFIPSGAKQMAKLTLNDDFQKLSTEWNTLVQKELSNKDLPDSYNIFGKKINNFGFLTKYRHGPAEKEVLRVMPKINPKDRSVNFSYLNNTFTTAVPLTAKEQEFLDYNSGTIFTQIIENELLNPKSDQYQAYQNADLTIQKAYIKKALGKSRSIARDMLKSDGTGDYAKSEYYESLNSRSLDLFEQKYNKLNGGDVMSLELKQQFDQAKETFNINGEQ